MNKHTLNYHTRLHDWYRQHSIQLQREELQHGNSQQQQQLKQHHTPDPAGTGEIQACEGGNLTQDKLYAIHDWCADVNRNLFRVKKREAPPLFRRCRVTSASTVASRGSSAAAGRQKVKNSTTGFTPLQLRSADPRRVRSADVFTMTGHWAKQPKVKITGGELLPKRPGTAPRNVYSRSTVQRAKQASVEDLDLCIRNSKDTAELHDLHALPRVNHDSFHLRQNALVLKQNGSRLAERMPGSPRDSAIVTPDPGKYDSRLVHPALRQQICTSCNITDVKGVKRAKSAHSGARLRFMDEKGEVLKAPNHNVNHIHKDSDNQRAVEVVENAKNNERSKHVPDGNTSLNNQERKEELHDDRDTLLHVKPGFCNTCSGIYSGSTDAHSASACGNCVHGIKLDSTQQLESNLQQQQRQKHITASAKMSAAEKISAELRKTEAEVSMVEARLSENGIHYSAERAAIREEHRGPGFGRPSMSKATQLRARLASQMALDEGTEEGDEDKTASDRSEYSDDDQFQIDDVENEFSGAEHDGKTKKELHVTILSERGSHQDNKYQNVGDGRRGEDNVDDQRDARGDDDLEDTDINGTHDIDTNKENNIGVEDIYDEGKDSKRLARPSLARDGRRKSISFSYKPVIAAPSVSNSLLNVLSIDDCKFHMRYSPHKVLEEHEITENLMLPLAFLQFNNDNDDIENNDSLSKQQQPNETNSKVAMRISRGSSPDDNDACNDHKYKCLKTKDKNGLETFSPNTSIRSSTARHATATNVRKFQAMNDPDNINFHGYRRPQSACLAQAFHTLIHDRTVMQRFDNMNNNGHSNTEVRSRTPVDPVRLTKSVQRNVAKSAGKLSKQTDKVDVGKRTDTVRGGRDIRSNSKKWVLPDDIDLAVRIEGGPHYRLINAALRRHMGDLLQEQSKKLQIRYQRQKNLGVSGMSKMKRHEGGKSTSPTPSLSLSLDSLPETKKGILKTQASPGSRGSASVGDTDTVNRNFLEVSSGEVDPMADGEH